MQKFRLLNIDRKEWIQLGSLPDIAASDPAVIPYLMADTATAADAPEYFGRWGGDHVTLVGSLNGTSQYYYDAPEGGRFGEYDAEEWADITQEACAEAAEEIGFPKKSGGNMSRYAPEYG